MKILNWIKQLLFSSSNRHHYNQDYNVQLEPVNRPEITFQEPERVMVGDAGEDSTEARERLSKHPDPMDRLTEHFRYREMIHSNTAKRLGIDNTPSRTHIHRFTALCENVMEPIRTHFASPVTVTSGYRCLELNRAIGSHDNSQHTKGEAVDFTINGFDTEQVFRWIVDESEIEFDQIIYEFAGSWIHISYTTRRENRNEVLSAHKINGNTVYRSWESSLPSSKELNK